MASLAGGVSVQTGLGCNGGTEAVPELLDRRVEEQLARGRNDDPGAAGQFALELVGAPAGVARKDAVARRFRLFAGHPADTLLVADEDTGGDLARRRVRVVGPDPVSVAVEHDDSGGRAWPAAVDGEGQVLGLGRAIDHQAKRPLGPVTQQEDNSLDEVRVLEDRTGDEKGAREWWHGCNTSKQPFLRAPSGGKDQDSAEHHSNCVRHSPAKSAILWRTPNSKTPPGRDWDHPPGSAIRSPWGG